MTATLTHEFAPARWLRGRHLQTVFGPLFRRAPRVRTARERWELPDGDFVDVDRLDAPAAAPLLLVLHGLEGSSSAHYVRGFLAEGRARGWRALALNFRSCSGEVNRLLRSYHSGETGDLDLAARRAIAESPGAPVVAVGCSLGGNVLVKWLGEIGGSAPPELRAAAAISVPFDLRLCAQALDGPGLMTFVYRTRFLRSLKRKAAEKARAFPGAFDTRRVASARTLFEFDDALTGPVHGFAGAEDYWARCSSGPFVARVGVPLLLLSAADDPFIPASCIPVVAGRENPFVKLELTQRGGHLGFVSGPWRPWFYAEKRVAQFLAAHVAPSAAELAPESAKMRA